MKLSKLAAVSGGFVLLGLLLCLTDVPSFAQAVSGTISGYINDPSGAAVVGAAVKVTNTLTGVEISSTSDASGLFVISNLSPGTYNIDITAPGFRRYRENDVVLNVDSSVRVNAVLTLGAVSEEVTVSASTGLIETEKTDVAQQITERQIESLPTVGRNLSKLYNLVPGVVQNIFQVGAGENPSEFNGTLVNGQFFGNSEYQIDGITDTACCFSGFQVIVPNQESVLEMKIATASYDPEFGASGGMVAQYVIKTGTNDLHGSAFWFNRNKATFAADPFTEKLPGTGKDGKGFGPSPYNSNQAGFSLGGPFVRNKMFWFGDFQATRTRQGGQITATVPNDAFRAGDFSAYASTHPIFDPLTGNPDGSGRQQFSCDGRLNVICPSRFSPVAVNLLALLPRANLNQNTDVNFVGSGTEVFDQNQIDTRYDYNITSQDRLFARYTYFGAHLDNPPIFGRKAGGPAVGGLSPQTGDFRSQQVAVNYTHTFSGGFLAELRLGFMRFRLDGLQADVGLNTNTEVGIPGINTSDPLTQGLAGINVNGPVGGWGMGISSGVGIPRLDRTSAYQIVNNWTRISGNHQHRWGADLRRHRFDFIAVNASSRGNFNFAQAITGTQEVAGSGLGMASFLLGDPSGFDRAVFSGYTSELQDRDSFYYQDVWRISPKLTLNLGIRYDYFSPVRGRVKGGLVNFDPSAGDLLLAGLGDVSNTANVRKDLNNFAPRVGLAYRITSKNVIRAGFGRSYFGANYGGVFYHLTSTFPLSAQQTITQDNIRFPIFPIQQGPPAAPTPEFPASGHLTPPAGSLIKYRPTDNATEYIDSWNLTLENQVTKDLTVSVAYVGNVGRKLWWPVNINAAPPGPGPLLERRPYFQAFGIDSPITNGCNCVNSSYNSLQVSVNKRFSAGYSIISSFTWAKALDYELGGFGWSDQAVNPYDAKGVYGVSTYNRAAVWTVAHSWELPFGKGKAFGTDMKPVANLLVGGWNFHGITTVESGFPFSPVLGDGSSLNADFGQRPDLVGDFHVSEPSRDQWYNPAAFAAPECCRWGNAGRNIMRGPGLFTVDWSFWKEFVFRERFRAQVRWENFNLFNHTNLGQPANTVDGSTAGRITSLAGAGGGFGNVPMRRMQFGLRLTW
jgi:hypothetical protein